MVGSWKLGGAVQMTIEKLREILNKRNKPHWTHREFLQFVSLEDREFFIAFANVADELLAVYEAAKTRLIHGHNDTCSYSLSREYPCTCGYTDLKEAIEKLEGNGDDN